MVPNQGVALQTFGGRELARVTRRLRLEGLGDAALELPMAVLAASGKCVLRVIAKPDGASQAGATVCRRWVE